MLDAKTQAKLQDDCTRAIQGYTLATGAACAAMTGAMFQSWIDGLESIRPGKEKDRQPKSWYRHPDEPTFPSPGQPAMPGTTSAWPWFGFDNSQMALNLPMPGWWVFTPTSHPMTTWPMAYGLEAYGIPKPIAWPLAEANSAALSAAETISDAFTKPSAATPKRPQNEADRDNTQDNSPASAFDLAVQFQVAQTELIANWWFSFKPVKTNT